MKNLSIAFALVVGSVAGCAEPLVGEVDESVTQETSALGTLPTGTFKLKNYQTGLCLGVAAGTPNWGVPFITWTCDNSANQTWSQNQKSSATDKGVVVQMVNHVADNMCLHSNSPAANGTPVVTLACFLSQQILGWKPIYSGTNLEGHECYRFMKEGSTTHVLGVAGGNPNRGTKTILWTDFNNAYSHPDQFWCIY